VTIYAFPNHSPKINEAEPPAIQRKPHPLAERHLYDSHNSELEVATGEYERPIMIG
jgi:hypothetical protein